MMIGGLPLLALYNINVKRNITKYLIGFTLIKTIIFLLLFNEFTANNNYIAIWLGNDKTIKRIKLFKCLLLHTLWPVPSLEGEPT